MSTLEGKSEECNLLVYFHGVPRTAKHMVEKIDCPLVTVVRNIGTGSAIYEALFTALGARVR